jgi:putative transcriptional regulator
MAKEKRVYNRIKAVLAENRKTNLWLSDELQVNRTTVSKWCTNEVQPTMESLFRIANALNVNIRDLLVSNIK